MKRQNKFLLHFDLDSLDIAHSPTWVVERLQIEEQMRNWCIERIGESGFPNWQFSTIYIPAMSMVSGGNDNLLMADGIYIGDDEDRTAFKLTFNL